MTTKHKHDNPILVTGAAGAVGGIGRKLTEFLLAKGHKVRALVRREDERAEALRRLGAEVVQGDLTDLASMHRAIEGCRRILRSSIFASVLWRRAAKVSEAVCPQLVRADSRIPAASVGQLIELCLVPLHRDFDRLDCDYSSSGRYFESTSTSMLRAVLGCLLMKPARSSVNTIW